MKLRIVQVMECTIGGTRRHITDLCGGLADRGVEVHAVVSAERQPEFRRDLAEISAKGCVVHELPMVRQMSPIRDAGHGVALARLLKRIAPDLVHTHSSKAGVLGRLASIVTDIGPRIHTFHTPAFLFREMFGPLKRRLFFQLEKNLGEQTRRLVAVSESEARTIVSSGVVSAEKIAVVPNGIDPRPYRDVEPVDLESVGLRRGRATVAVVGLLNVAKGQDLAIEALATPGNEDLQLLLAGHGDRLSFLRRRAEELSVSDRIAFLGFRGDVPELLAASDLLLLPSRWEAMPYALLEAMAAGLPVVSTPVDGAVDLIEPGRNGWLSESVTGESVGRTLAEVFTMPASALREAGVRGRELVLEGYTVEAMVDRLLDLYAEL
jgi:glycosyltransferase involved in cell wall biosynthesis